MLPTMDFLFGRITGLIDVVIGVLFTLASAAFAWGVIQYFTAAGDEKKLSGARSYMIYGIITLAVMASAWGIANLLIDTFRL